MKKQKRRVLELRWSRLEALWFLTERGTSWRAYSPNMTKREFLGHCAIHARRLEPSQLVVKTKRGTISFERTYGSDPRRSLG